VSTEQSLSKPSNPASPLAASRSKSATLIAQMEESFSRQVQASMMAMKVLADTSIRDDLRKGVECALDSFFRAIDEKLQDMRRMSEKMEAAKSRVMLANRSASELQQQIDATNSRNPSSSRKFFALLKKEARSLDVNLVASAQAECLAELRSATQSYIACENNATLLRAEAAQILNAASMFLTEQVAVSQSMGAIPGGSVAQLPGSAQKEPQQDAGGDEDSHQEAPLRAVR